MVALLQSQYANDPNNCLSELADALKLSGTGGKEILDALRAQGNAAGTGFAGKAANDLEWRMQA